MNNCRLFGDKYGISTVLNFRYPKIEALIDISIDEIVYKIMYIIMLNTHEVILS